MKRSSSIGGTARRASYREEKVKVKEKNEENRWGVFFFSEY